MKNYETQLREIKPWVEETFAKLDKKLVEMAIRSRDKLPDGVDENGMHIDCYRTKPHWWCNGFFGGLNYMMYAYTKNEEYLKTAKRSEELMDTSLVDYDHLDHDLGFRWHILSGAGYRLTGDKKSRTRDLYAASALFSRFVPSGGYIRAWNPGQAVKKGVDNGGYSIIDCLMNLPLLYWASDEIGDDRFKQIAMAHADMAIIDHLRDDGSVNHIVDHDRETGEVIATLGGQGIAEGSSWSRGQAWAVYGFTISYLHTKEVRYLDAAKRAANYFIANVCDDWLPRVDFRAPGEPVYYDSTAGACAACGLIELAKILPEHEGGMYMNAAVNILRAMTEKFCDFDPANDHVLGYGTVRYPTEEAHYASLHISIIYGDFFYTEALLKLMGSEFNPW